MTRQRRILLGLIENTSGHLHASDILRLAREKDSSIDWATVYRTLSLLKTKGLVEKLDLLHLDGSEHHYELRDQYSHVHIGCTKCGKILEFRTDLVERLEVEIRIEVVAVCPECRQ